MADDNNPQLPLTPPGGDGGGPTGAANIVPIIQAISRGSGMRPAKPGE